MKITLLIFLLMLSAQADVYRVPNYLGGMNTVTDSIDLPANQAVNIVNMNFDKPNVLTSRPGYHYLYATEMPSGGTVDAIFDYEYESGSWQKVIIKNGFVYIVPGLGDPGNVDWDTLRLSFDGDSLAGNYGSSWMDMLDNSVHLLVNVSNGDILVSDSDTSETEYLIQYITYDYRINMYDTYNGANTIDSGFTIYKKISGTPSITQHEDKLYISGSGEYTIIYDGSAGTYQFAALVDTGTIDTVYTVTDSTIIYDEGCVNARPNSNVIKGRHCEFTSANGVVAGKIITIFGPFEGFTGSTWGSEPLQPISAALWSSAIDSVDENANTIMTVDAWPYYLVACREYEIVNPLGTYHPDATHYVVDRSKNWYDSDFDTEYLQEFFMVSYTGGLSKYANLYNSTDSMVAIDTSFTVGHFYYIFNRLPSYYEYARSQKFDQVLFKNGIMYAFGEETWSDMEGNYDGALNRIWYSAIDMPFYMKPTQFFDLGVGEDITCMFSLKNGIYIATGNSIWRMTGDRWHGDLSYRMVVSNIGIGELSRYAKATEDYIYFIDDFGIYRFDGVRADPISHGIDNWLGLYNNGHIVTGYFDEKFNVFFHNSYNSIVYDELIGSFYRTHLRYNCFYNPPDTNIFYFGHFNDSNNVYYYPDDCYLDSSSSSEANAITNSYETGWFAPGGLYNPEGNTTLRRIDNIVWTITSDSVTTLYAYKDFDTTPFDTITFDSTGTHVYNETCDNRWAGEYFKFKVENTRKSKLILRPYEVHYRWLPPLQK